LSVTTPREWLLAHVAGDHQRLLERLRSLDHCLETSFYVGAVYPEKRGLGGLRLRCRELKETLEVHIPAEERMFAELEVREEWRPLVGRLREEHQTLRRLLDETLESLDQLVGDQASHENLQPLQERVRTLSSTLQNHITTENRTVLRLLAAA
jgi:iron-sulfur cluster repair protein YtfE (RIC family)